MKEKNKENIINYSTDKMIRNKDSVPECQEGKELILGTRAGFLTIGNGINLLSVIGSIPLYAIGMPINYILKEKDKSLTTIFIVNK